MVDGGAGPLVREGVPTDDLFFVLDGHAVVHIDGVGEVARLGTKPRANGTERLAELGHGPDRSARLRGELHGDVPEGRGEVHGRGSRGGEVGLVQAFGHTGQQVVVQIKFLKCQGSAS